MSAPQSPSPTPLATEKTVCRVHCSICEGQDHHWDYFGDEDENGDPAYSCKHCEATKPMEDADG